MAADAGLPAFGLYLHWPFCASKCPYCDFNSHVAETVDHDRWLAAFAAEIRRTAREIGPRILSTVYFGGGTPSLMPPRLVDGLLAGIRAAWPLANDIEVTLEANPGSVDVARFRDFRAAGVNRVSLGLQALNDVDLRRLGRTHTADDGRRALEAALATFERVSFDLIYARQDQTPGDWEAELAEALGLGARHMSLYQLTIEDGTVFGSRHARGLLRGLPSDDTGADMYALTARLTEDAGMPAYEISSHAVPGEESRHNLIYWSRVDYAGIGPGAHGRLSGSHGARYATEAWRQPARWLDAVERSGRGEARREALDPDDQVAEALLMGLRIAQGVPESLLRGHSKKEALFRNIRYLEEIGMVHLRHGRLRASSAGRPLLNSVLAALIP